MKINPRTSNYSYIPLSIISIFQLFDLAFGYSDNINDSALSQPLFVCGAIFFIVSLLDFRNTYYPLFPQKEPVTKEMRIKFHTIIVTNAILLININAVLNHPRLLGMVFLILSPGILIFVFLFILKLIRRIKGENE